LQQEMTWEEQLATIIEELPKLHVTVNEMNLEMAQYKLFSEKLSVYIPSEFVEMSSINIKQKYPHDARPEIVFCNSKNTVNICFTVVKEDASEMPLLDLRDLMKGAFLTVNPASKILDEGDFIKDENGVAYYAFSSHAIGGQMYNLLFITAISGELLVCSLNCLKKDMDKYKLLFYGIMKTTKVENE